MYKGIYIDNFFLSDKQNFVLGSTFSTLNIHQNNTKYNGIFLSIYIIKIALGGNVAITGNKTYVPFFW